MPFAQIDDKGTSIYYEDSGAPDGYPRYTTVVFVHGTLINSATFQRMLPYAPKHGLRMITMNCRDYRGSSPYTTEELADIVSSDIDVQASVVRKWGREVALFLAYVCQVLRTPAIAGEGAKKEGGVVLVTWSSGGIAALSILGDPQTLGDDLAATLTPYLRKIILYDPPSRAYGFMLDAGFAFPLVDPSIPPEKKADAFLDWASAYHTAIPDGVAITPEALLKYNIALPRTPTLRTLAPEDLERTIDRTVATRSVAISGTDARIRQRHARRAFLDADAVLPDVDLLVLWCDQSVWLTIWGVKVFDNLASEEVEPGKRKRRASLLRVRDANHFVHWDEPERMVRLFAEICSNSSSATTTTGLARSGM
ncbi:uncharacterized protein PHACADRAFT_213720 [Phanerochaete carnosa HHB-10118-sp]|uniref:AB hydrolase-1 domain-containing protein n=1 Tax=Phanerochaete carnosa (strain HHB-10118-sp) TaxID=650164 RepID=K5VT30_PHACS|nr:uncharacterized protein PHACADRAFT_213720 [Phanerochaete carnosa HHB-10118-sp]EKM49940.1 hypothetical protein PHACADRAFT_213720 [Phanerochaete carnosa HHB-10118-sp]